LKDLNQQSEFGVIMQISISSVMRIVVAVLTATASFNTFADGTEAASPEFKQPISECIWKADYSYTSCCGRRFDIQHTPSEWLKIAGTERPQLCLNLLQREILTESYKLMHNCIITNPKLQETFSHLVSTSSSIYIDDVGNDLVKETLNKCAASITTQDVIDHVKFFSNKYKDSIDAEAKQKVVLQLDEQRKKDALEAKQRHLQVIADARKIIRNFSIKDINLSLSKAQLIEGANKYWDCKNHGDHEIIEVCTIAFSQLASIPNITDTPYGQRTVQRTARIYSDPSKYPPSVKKISTVGGEPVRTIQAMFYKGKMYEVDISLEAIEYSMKDSISEKYGPPQSDSNKESTWYGKDEELSLSYPELLIKIENPTVSNAITKTINDRIEAQRVADQKKEKAESERRKRDF
jgi:hypothetical protein